MLSCLWFKKNIYWLKRSKIFGNYKNLRSFYTYISFSNKYFNHKKTVKWKMSLYTFNIETPICTTLLEKIWSILLYRKVLSNKEKWRKIYHIQRYALASSVTWLTVYITRIQTYSNRVKFKPIYYKCTYIINTFINHCLTQQAGNRWVLIFPGL